MTFTFDEKTMIPVSLKLGYDFRISRNFWFEPAVSFAHTNYKYAASGNEGTSDQVNFLLGFIGMIPFK